MADSIGKGFPVANIQIGHVFCDIDDLSLWKYLGGNPLSVASWILIHGRLDTQPDTSQWGLSQAGAMWFYTPERMYYGWNGSVLVPVAYYGSPNCYNYRTMFTLQDDFLTGIATSGRIGSLGWLSSGTIAVQASESNRPGIYRLSTGAVINTQVRISPHQSSSYDGTLQNKVTWIVRVNQVDADTQVRIGAASSVAGNPPNNGFYFEKLGADTDWMCVLRSGATNPARIDTNVPVDTNFMVFQIEVVGQTVSYYINNTKVGEYIGEPLPVVPIAPYVFLINLAAADKSMDVDYFDMVGLQLVR